MTTIQYPWPHAPGSVGEIAVASLTQTSGAIPAGDWTKYLLLVMPPSLPRVTPVLGDNLKYKGIFVVGGNLEPAGASSLYTPASVALGGQDEVFRLRFDAATMPSSLQGAVRPFIWVDGLDVLCPKSGTAAVVTDRPDRPDVTGKTAVSVANAAALTTAVNGFKAGSYSTASHYIRVNGGASIAGVTVDANGTLAHPLVIKCDSPTGATLTGIWPITGTHVWINNFLVGTGATISPRALRTYITRNHFIGLAQIETKNDQLAKSARIGWNTFDGHCIGGGYYTPILNEANLNATSLSQVSDDWVLYRNHGRITSTVDDEDQHCLIYGASGIKNTITGYANAPETGTVGWKRLFFHQIRAEENLLLKPSSGPGTKLAKMGIYLKHGGEIVDNDISAINNGFRGSGLPLDDAYPLMTGNTFRPIVRSVQGGVDTSSGGNVVPGTENGRSVFAGNDFGSATVFIGSPVILTTNNTFQNSGRGCRLIGNKNGGKIDLGYVRPDAGFVSYGLLKDVKVYGHVPQSAVVKRAGNCDATVIENAGSLSPGFPVPLPKTWTEADVGHLGERAAATGGGQSWWGDLFDLGTADATRTAFDTWADLYIQNVRVRDGHYGWDGSSSGRAASDLLNSDGAYRRALVFNVDAKWGYKGLNATGAGSYRPHPEGYFEARQVVMRSMPAHSDVIAGWGSGSNVSFRHLNIFDDSVLPSSGRYYGVFMRDVWLEWQPHHVLNAVMGTKSPIVKDFSSSSGKVIPSFYKATNHPYELFGAAGGGPFSRTAGTFDTFARVGVPSSPYLVDADVSFSRQVTTASGLAAYLGLAGSGGGPVSYETISLTVVASAALRVGSLLTTVYPSVGGSASWSVASLGTPLYGTASIAADLRSFAYAPPGPSFRGTDFVDLTVAAGSVEASVLAQITVFEPGIRYGVRLLMDVGSYWEITDDVLRMSISRRLNVFPGAVEAGTADFEIDNTAGWYSPLRTEMHGGMWRPNAQIEALASYTEDGGAVSSYFLFRGLIDGIDLSPALDSRIATVQARDMWKVLQRVQVTTTLMVGAPVNSILTSVMAASSLEVSAYSIDAITDVLPFAWYRGVQLDGVLGHMIEAGGYAGYVSADGTVRVRDRLFIIGGEAVGSYEDVAAMNVSFTDDDVINKIAVTGNMRAPLGSITTIAQIIDPLPVPASSSVTFWLEYQDSRNQEGCPARSLSLPVSSTDWLLTATSITTSSAYNAQASVSTTLFGQAAKVTLFNGTNAQRWISKFRLRGDPIVKQGATTAELEVSSSQEIHGVRAYSLESDIFADLNLLQRRAADILDLHAGAEPAIDLRVIDDLPGVFRMDLSNVVVLVNSFVGISDQWTIYAINHDIAAADAGWQHVTGLTLQRARALSGFVLDVDHLDSGRLGR